MTNKDELKQNQIILPLIDNSNLSTEVGSLCFAFAILIVKAFHAAMNNKKTKNEQLAETALNFILQNHDIQDEIVMMQIEDAFKQFKTESSRTVPEDANIEEGYEIFYADVLNEAWCHADFSESTNSYREKFSDRLDRSEMLCYLFGFQLIPNTDLSKMSKTDLDKYLLKFGPLMIKGGVGVINSKTLNDEDKTNSAVVKIGELKSADNKIVYTLKYIQKEAYDESEEGIHYVVLLPTFHNETPFIFYIDPWNPSIILMTEWLQFRNLLTTIGGAPYFLPCGTEVNKFYAKNKTINDFFIPDRNYYGDLSDQEKINDCHHLRDTECVTFTLNDSFKESIRNYQLENNKEKKYPSDYILSQYNFISNLSKSSEEEQNIKKIQKRKIVELSKEDELTLPEKIYKL